MRRSASIIFFVMLLFSSCSVYEKWTFENQSKGDVYEEIMVSKSNLPLFADLGSLGLDVKTRGNIGNESISLESLLDRSKTAVTSFEQYRVREIPFLSNSTPSYAILSNDVPESFSGLITSAINLFLVEVIDTVSNTVDRKVVTLIPDADYIEKYANIDYSYISKGVFSGIILFSDLTGRFRDVYIYGGNFQPILNADVIDLSERPKCNHSLILSLVGSISTRTSGNDDGETEAKDNGSGGNIEIEGSICIGYKKPPVESDRPSSGNPGVAPGALTDGNEISGLSGGGGGGGANSGVGIPSDNDGNNNSEGGDSALDDNDGFVGKSFDVLPSTQVGEEVFKYLVSLSAGEGGTTSGSGSYLPGVFAICEAKPDSLYLFDRWVGDFKGRDDVLEFMVTKSVSSTAYFRSVSDSGPIRPCYDASRKMYNPLKEMILAPTDSAGTRVIAATFGDSVRYNRDGSKKGHTGLDLYAPEGTPVYAMCDGKISDRRYIDSQPNRNKGSKDWPKDYSGDKREAGNRFIIESQIDGKTYYFLFWHMQAGTPVAVNPRTGKPFSPGDLVYAGEVVGYTGRTGNAYNVPFIHLHLGVQNSSGENINPEPFINGELQWEDDSRKKIINREVINIRCDSEIQEVDFGL